MISSALNPGTDHRMTGRMVATLFLVVGAAVLAGLGAGVLGWPLLIVLAALPVAVAVFYRPFFGVLLLVATLPVENLLMFSGVGLGRILGLAVFGAWLVQKLAKRQSWRRVVSGTFFPVALGFLAWILASMLWAEHRPPVRTGFIRIAQLVALALIVIDITDSRRKLDLIAKVLILSALFAAGTTLYQAEVLGVRRAGADISGGINSTAVLLVTIIPVGFYLLRTSRGFIWKLVGALYIGVATVSVVMTYSRLNLLLLPPLIGVLYLLTIRERQGRRWLLAVTVLGAVGATLFVPWDRLGKRIDSIGSYVDETMQLGPVQTEQSERGYHLLIGLAIARDHPLIGVGYGNYGHFFRDEYQFQVLGAPRTWDSVRSPHSSYVGIAADLGAIGLAIWLLLLGLCAASAIRAWRRARAGRLPGVLPMIETLVLMLGLHIAAYGFYTPNQKDKLLWMIMAMCIAVGYVVTSELRQSDLSGSEAGSELEPGRSGLSGGSLPPVSG